MSNQSEELEKQQFLNKIREYLKKEKQYPNNLFFEEKSYSVEEAQERINMHFYQCGRDCVLEDILKWEQGLQEREFQIRKRKGTL